VTANGVSGRMVPGLAVADHVVVPVETILHERGIEAELCQSCSTAFLPSEPFTAELCIADVDISVLSVPKTAGTVPASPPDPEAFKEAVRHGAKLWPVLTYYLAALGQTRLIRQRLDRDLRTSER